MITTYQKYRVNAVMLHMPIPEQQDCQADCVHARDLSVGLSMTMQHLRSCPAYTTASFTTYVFMMSDLHIHGSLMVHRWLSSEKTAQA